MVRKKNGKTYIVHHRGRASHGGFTVLGRYRVGAKSEKNAEDLLRQEIGKHCNVKVYYEKKEDLLPIGRVVREC